MLRAGRNVARELAATFTSVELATCGVVRCEVLRGVAQPAAKTKLAGFFDLIVNVPTDDSTWQATEELAWQLDRAGRVLPLTDVLIAVCALTTGASVLTLDRHFSMIPQLRLASW